MGELYESGGDLYYLSDGAIVGIAIAAFVVFIIIPILCCCFCCGWCCFGGRNKNTQTQQLQIYQPPPQDQSPVATTQQQVLSHTSMVASHNHVPASQQQRWNYSMEPTYSHGQGQINSGYAGQLPQYRPQYYPEPRYYPQQPGQYPSNQFQQSYYSQGQQETRIPRNYLGQTAYDIYEPKRAEPKLPRPRIG